MSRMIRLGLVCGLLSLFLVGGFLLAFAHEGPSDPYLATQTGAIESVASQVAGREVALERTGADSLGFSDYRDSATGDIYIVDDKSGQVVFYGSITASDRSAQGGAAGEAKYLTDGQVRRIALELASERFPRWLGHNLIVEYRSEGIRTDGSEHKTIRCTFKEYRYGLPTCNFLELTLNAETGELIGFLQSDGPIELDMSRAAMSDRDAIEVVAKAAHMPVHTVKESERMVWRAPSTREPHLVLRVVLETGDQYFGARAEGFVDLHTGELLSLGM